MGTISAGRHPFTFPEETNIMNKPTWNFRGATKSAFEQMDRMRRRQGERLDASGYGPVESPYRIIHEEPGVRLRCYGNPGSREPALLIVPAPIKRPYIWDLSPEVSVVQRCLEQGMRVYLAEWMQPEEAGSQAGLADYGDRLLTGCLEAIASDNGSREVILAGHSLGGILATICACLHPQQVRALILLESPLHFGADAGNFAPLVTATPDIGPIGETFANVPGSFLNMVSAAAAPHAFQWEPCLDWSLSMASPAAMKTHMRVQRWMRDEFPLPGQLFADIVERLYRHDELMAGRLPVSGRQIGPRDLKTPLLSVVDPRSTVIPPQSVLPFHEAAASSSKKVLHYEGDIGVGIQHVDVLVGSSAHAVLWPAAFGWLRELGLLQ